MTLPMEDRWHEVEISCDGDGCQTVTYHSMWALSLRSALTRARLELVSHHGWSRHRIPDGRGALDRCPPCTAAALTRTTNRKELCSA